MEPKSKYIYKRQLSFIADPSERPFKCPEPNCPYRAKRREHLKKHKENVHNLKSPSTRPFPFPCQHPGCSYVAKQKGNLKIHSKVHTLEKSFVCSHPNCNFSSNHKQSLNSHFRIHTGEKPYKCQFESCSYATTTPGQLIVHTRTHTKERPYKCPEANCEYSAAQGAHLKAHRLTHPEPKPEPGSASIEGEMGKVGERPSFPCPLCEYTAKLKHTLAVHIKRHLLEKRFKCDEPSCKYETKTKSHLAEHTSRMHCLEKPFKCPFESCEFSCLVEKSLTTHEKTHSADRRYKCGLCPFRGKQTSTVKNHLKSIHSDPNFRPFKCTWTESKCDYAAKTKGHLKSHLLTHQGEKKYKCSFPQCDFKAITAYRIQQHEKAFHKKQGPRLTNDTQKIQFTIS